MSRDSKERYEVVVSVGQTHQPISATIALLGMESKGCSTGDTMIAQDWLATRPIGTTVSDLAIARGVCAPDLPFIKAHNFQVPNSNNAWARYERVDGKWKRTS